jgi:hypothetical protein
LVLVAACDGDAPPPGPRLAQVVQGQLVPDRALLTSAEVTTTPTQLDENGEQLVVQPVAASGQEASVSPDVPSQSAVPPLTGNGPAPNQPGPVQLGGIGDWSASVTLDAGSTSAQIGRIWLHPPYENVTVDSNPFPIASSLIVTAQGLAADWEDTSTNQVFCTPYVPTTAFSYRRVGAGDLPSSPFGITPPPGIEYDGKLYFTTLVTALGSGSTAVTKMSRYDSGGPEFRVISNTRGNDGDDTPGEGILFNGSLFLPLNDTATDFALKLWRYNSDDEQLRQITNLFDGDNDDPRDFTIVNGELYFTALRAAGQRRIYRYSEAPDRTPIAVIPVTPTDFRDPVELVELGGELYFHAAGPTGPRKVWKYVPSSNSIRQVSNINDGFSDFPLELTVYSGKLYFVGQLQSGQEHVYVYDPNADDFRLVFDTNPGTDNFDEPSLLTVSDGRLYFRSRVDASFLAVWSHDATTNQLRRISDLGGPQGDDPEQLAPYADGVLFVAKDAFNDRRLYHFSAAANVVRTVTSAGADVSYDISQITHWGNYAAFVAGDSTGSERKLYLYDGVGNSLMADLAGPGNNDNIVILGPYGSSLAFAGGPSANSASLYLLTPN